MELRQRPEVRQKITLSPQVYQGLSILAMPLADLELVIQQELVENPTLEVEEYDDGGTDERDDSEAATTAEEQAAWDDWLDQYEDLAGAEPVVPRDPNPEEMNTDDYVGGVVTFEDHLSSQLAMLTLSVEVERAALAVIGSLDEDGFFDAELAEIAAVADVTPEVALAGLEAVQQLDPLGVGARDVGEALLIQMRALGIEDGLLRSVVDSHLDDVASNRYHRIARAQGVKEIDVRSAVEKLKTLNPRPKGAFSPGIAPAYIVPDVTIRRFGDEWMVLPNNDALPVLRVNSRYRRVLRGDEKVDAATERYLKDKIRGAESFIKNVERRKDTVSRIAQIIVETQGDYFDTGTGDLRPLRLEDVAGEIGVHLSTVSRGVTGKYMATPYGMYELKYFFSGGYRMSDGMDIAATTVKKKLADIVEGEDRLSPLSDQKIAEALGREGIEVARRTVAKYREELGIEPSWARRRR